eukprot:COSAG02_NODE_4020_length_5892_cov_7.078716_3_plen_641_part_00
MFPSEEPQPSEVLITIVGFGSATKSGWSTVWFTLSSDFSGYKIFDLYRGVELHMPTTTVAGARVAGTNSSINVAVTMEASMESVGGKFGPSGFGALLLCRSNVTDPALALFLEKMSRLTTQPLGNFSCEGGPQCHGGATAWPFYPSCNSTNCAGLLQTMVDNPPTQNHSHSPTIAGESMLSVPGGSFLFESYGEEWRPPPDRGKLAGQRGVGVQFPWQQSPTIPHSHMLTVGSLFVSKYPVTNQQYARFLNESGYKPVDTEHWLQHWETMESPSTMQLKRPVTYVSLSDANAFCRHYSARLPHTWEWNWFASAGTLYPWGSSAPTNLTCPPIGGGIGENLTAAPPADVDAYPAGCAPSGVCDLVGNTWEMTDAFADQHNRAVVLKGGSRYHASGSMWYFPNALAVNTHEKAFLFSDGYERSGTVGFRCVADSSVPIIDPCTKCKDKACLCLGGNTPQAVSGDVDLSKARNWISTAVSKSVVVAHKDVADSSAAMNLSFVDVSKASRSSVRPYCCSPLGLSWADGAVPHSNASSSHNGIDTTPIGSGFRLQVSTTNQARRLTIFAGCWSASCKLHTEMDGQQPIVREMTIGREVLMYRWEIIVRSADDSTGMLTATWIVTDGDGNVTFQAAMLEDISDAFE